MDEWEKLVSCESVASQQGYEHGIRAVFIVRSRCLATPSEDIEALMFAVVICRVCKSMEVFVEELLCGLALQSTVLVDNISYHSRKKERFPTKSWKKDGMQEWLKMHDAL
jgi:hypothetical protein